jgi:hypothetical protein
MEPDMYAHESCEAKPVLHLHTTIRHHSNHAGQYSSVPTPSSRWLHIEHISALAVSRKGGIYSIKC